MDAREVQRIIRDTARETVGEMLHGLGLTADDPHEMQADMHYLRKLRKGNEFIGLRVKSALIAVLIPGLLWLLWEALKVGFNR